MSISGFRMAGTLAVAATFSAALLNSDVSSASSHVARAVVAPVFTSEPVVQQTTNSPTSSETTVAPIGDEVSASAVPEAKGVETTPQPVERARSLAQHVADQAQGMPLSRDLHCLAGAIYFESKSESLAGQLAVGRVIIARSKSGRFPSTYCGVVFQRSQFSFVRGGGMPAIDRATRQWRNAVAIAQIAHANTWQSEAEGALFFHATHVSPNWGMKRVARIDGHIFYR